MPRSKSKPSTLVVVNQPVHTGVVHQLPEHITGRAAHYLDRYLQGSDNTKRAYAADLRSYEQFCHERELRPFPAHLFTLTDYLAHLADNHYKLATIYRHLASIQKKHCLQGLPSFAGNPELYDVMRGITLTLGKEQRQAPAFSVEHLKNCIRKLDLRTATGLRDRAILLMGFAGAFRRSELVALDLEHLDFQDDALIISILRSKTNQTGAAEKKALFYAKTPLFCPIAARHDWVGQLRGRQKGPLFVSIQRGRTPGTGLPTNRRLSDKSVNTLVGKHLGKTARGEPYTAHSFRSSFITTAKLADQSNDYIRNQTNHMTDASLSRYTRLADVIAYNAAKALGL